MPTDRTGPEPEDRSRDWYWPSMALGAALIITVCVLGLRAEPVRCVRLLSASGAVLSEWESRSSIQGLGGRLSFRTTDGQWVSVAGTVIVDACPVAP